MGGELGAVEHFKVVFPLGRSAVKGIGTGRRLPDPNGKTIGFIWDYWFRGDRMFPILERELGQRFPEMKFVDYTVFGNVHGMHEREAVAQIPSRLREHEVDAVIVGVGN
jgi:hypothetical protein